MNHTVMETLAKNIKKRRKELGLSQRELAERLSYSEKAISKWERGTGCPPTVLLPELAKQLQTDPNHLLYDHSERRLFLGIDGGGTKTHFALADENGTLLRCVTLGTSNPSDIGVDKMKDVLRAGILEVCKNYNYKDISIYAGLSGSSAEKDPIVYDFLSKFGFAKVANGNDAQNAVAACLKEKDGIAVVLGTGSIMYRQQKGKLHRIGGYGYLFVDPASGFAIGRDSILAALQYEDGSGAPTLVYDQVKAKLGDGTVVDNIDQFYMEGKRLLAQYAACAFRAYEQGDVVAREILEKNIRAIANLIRSAASPFEGEVKISLCGGLTNEKALLPLLKEQLNDEKRYCLSICDRPLFWGALRLAGLNYEEGYHHAEN